MSLIDDGDDEPKEIEFVDTALDDLRASRTTRGATPGTSWTRCRMERSQMIGSPFRQSGQEHAKSVSPKTAMRFV